MNTGMEKLIVERLISCIFVDKCEKKMLFLPQNMWMKDILSF